MSLFSSTPKAGGSLTLGTPGNKPLFGTTATPGTTNSLFGNKTAATAAPTGGLFGAPAAKSTVAPGGGFSFGAGTNPAAASTSKPGGLFGATATPAGAFNFNSTGAAKPATASTTPFSFNNPATSTSGGLFGGGFGGAAAVGGGGGLFGGGGGLNQQQQQNQQQLQNQQQQIQNNEEIGRLVQSVANPVVYGDERDSVLVKLNQLQAAYGIGKGIVAPGQPPVQYTLQNPYCRFKAVCYNRIPTHDNAEGFVSLIVSQPSDQLNAKLQEFKVGPYLQRSSDGLNKILGGKPSIQIVVENVKPLPDNRCEIVIYVKETGATGLIWRIPASDLATYLSSGNNPSQLQTQLCVTGLAAKTEIDDRQLQEYLKQPPSGMNHLLWQQAIADNPDPSKLIPWQLLGFKQLSDRHKTQISESEIQEKYTKELGKRVGDLEVDAEELSGRRRLSAAKQQELAHRLLKVMAAITLRQRLGCALDGQEETLKALLESVYAQIVANQTFKGKLTEFLSILRNQPQLLTTKKDAARKNREQNNENDGNSGGKNGQNGMSRNQMLIIHDFLEDFQNALEKSSENLESKREDLKIASKLISNIGSSKSSN